MRIFPQELQIGDDDGFREDLDIFNHKEFGEGLGRLFERVEDPLVAVLDAPWGTGKSTFIKMWCGAMRNRGFPVIYFDAFKNDYSGDAFTAIAGEVVALSDELVGETDEHKDFLKASLNVAQKIGLAAIKGGAKKIGEKLIGEDGVKDATEAFAQGGFDSALETIDGFLQERLKGRKEEKIAFDSFGSSLKKLASKLSDPANEHVIKSAKENHNPADAPDGATTPLPLIFVIDELDRCRPPFALEVIEKIKHFFSVTGVHFLLVTHLEQLENSVRHAYGMEQGSNIYLQKFYNITIYLPSEEISGRTQARLYLDTIFKNLPDDDEGGEYKNHIKEILVKYARTHQITLRTLEKISTSIAIILAVTPRNHLRTAYIVCGLCVIKALNSTLYQRILNKNATFDEISNYLQFGPINSYTARDSKDACAWAYALESDDYLKGHLEIKEMFQDYFDRFMLNKRNAILPSICRRLEGYAFL